MRLLFDTDAFCKLALCGVLRDVGGLLDADLAECGRLPALPYMLRRGRLRRMFGAEICDALIAIADQVPAIAHPSIAWLDRLRPVDAIDPGEAQIFAAAAARGLTVVSGDKRSLVALKDVDGFPEALSGRIVVLEAVLLALCNRWGPEVIRRRIQPLLKWDKLVQVCFSPSNLDPTEALLSYYSSLVTELDPLVLWAPLSGAET